MATTKGPWKADELDEQSVKIKLDRNHTHECIHIADVHVMSGNLGEEVPIAVANARLIAAAPDLLEALESVLRLKPLIDYPNNTKEKHIGEAMAIGGMLQKVESAIKKAKGL